MVIVCGSGMGDIFRRNSLNLGLHFIQSPEAVADARDGTNSSSIPGRARSGTARRGKTTIPCR